MCFHEKRKLMFSSFEPFLQDKVPPSMTMQGKAQAMNDEKVRLGEALQGERIHGKRRK